MKTFARYARPLVVTLLGKIAAYSTLAHVATADSVEATAAHRILMGLYWAFWPFAEVGSQIGQAFLPGARQKWPLTRRLLRVGVGVGAGSALAATAALYCSGALFTADAAVVSRLRGLAPLAAACVACLAPMCAAEGALLAERDLGFLSTFYAINAAAMVTAFSVIERVGLGIGAAWTCMLAFQVVRLGAFRLRLRRSRPTPPRWATDAWAGAREENGMRWFPGGVGSAREWCRAHCATGSAGVAALRRGLGGTSICAFCVGAYRGRWSCVVRGRGNCEFGSLLAPPRGLCVLGRVWSRLRGASPLREACLSVRANLNRLMVTFHNRSRQSPKFSRRRPPCSRRGPN